MNWNMKLINKSFVLGSLLLTVFATSCKKAWYDINRDPNNPVESNITPDLVAPAALLNTANRVGTGFGFLGNWLGYWCPAANYAPNVEEQSYNISTGFAAGAFNGILDNSYDYAFMEARAKETNQTFYEGIARIMKSHNFTQLVDLYNQIPYTEALQGLKNIRPKYDDGKSVYEDAIKQIDTGIALIKAAVLTDNVNIATADIMFKGDKTQWAKFGNTLKLRLLMHQANRSDRTAYIQAELAKIASEGSGFLGSGEDASVNPVYQSDKPNAFYASYGFNQVGSPATDFWRANVIAMNFLKINSDPRLGYFYKPIVGTIPATGAQPFSQPAPNNFRGNQYGLSINNVQYPYQVANFVSQVGGDTVGRATTAFSNGLVKGYNQNAWLITSIESLFLQAEATERGWLSGNKETAYKNAVLESFKWLNVGGTDKRDSSIKKFNEWYASQDANTAVSYAAATDKLKLIAFQKYIAMNGTNHLEAWTDYRRNGNYPVIPLSVNPGRTSTTLPYRLLFPQAEINLNTANVPTVGRKTADAFSDKIWWMP
jgi:hypothetical protein